jgi:hypothetical protein
MARIRTVLLFVVLVLAALACEDHILSAERRLQYHTANALLHHPPNDQQVRYLKAHLHNGELIIFSPQWTMDTVEHCVRGRGTRYTVDRGSLGEGTYALPWDSTALFETNQPIAGRDKGYRAALITISVINLAVSTFCAINPKACFGSCPTFYLPGDGGLHEARAEGFSSAIYPALQYADVDQLGHWDRTATGPLVVMKNEALETHVVDRLWLHAFPVMPGEEVRADPQDRFHRCSTPQPCTRATYQGQDVRSAVLADDGTEWWSTADAVDLRSSGTLDLDFAPHGRLEQPALMLTFRQTLLTTFLLYTALGYMGDDVSDHLARMQTDEALRRRVGGPLDALQDIRVEAWTHGRWETVATVHETGPIARNRVVVPLPAALAAEPEMKLRLRMTPGMYRLDHVGLADLLGPADGEVLKPTALADHAGCPVKGLDALQQRDDAKLCALPGDVHAITFQHPSGQADQWQLFLGADGYYLEWMRAEWLERTDPKRLRAMLMGNDAEWRSLTREFKAMETSMDAVFWNSQHPTPL